MILEGSSVLMHSSVDADDLAGCHSCDEARLGLALRYIWGTRTGRMADRWLIGKPGSNSPGYPDQSRLRPPRLSAGLQDEERSLGFSGVSGPVICAPVEALHSTPGIIVA